MPKKVLTPQAKHVLALIRNCGDIAIIHQNLSTARDVLSGIQVMCDGLNIEIDNGIFEHMNRAILEKPPHALAEEFQNFMFEIERVGLSTAV